MWDALKPIDGVSEEMLDRMAAMGIISIFDVEEIGRNVLEEDLEFPKQTADRCIERSIIRSKEVTIEQEEAKAAEEALRLEEEAAAAAVLDVEIDSETEAVADSILDLPTDETVEAETNSVEEVVEPDVVEVSEEPEPVAEESND